MFFIGDVHGLYKPYLELRELFDQSLALGDIGLGFGSDTVEDEIEKLPHNPNHLLLRGNHDNPIIFQKHPSAIPVWGYNEEMDMFWLGGGYSIDRQMRTPGFDWWPNEELPYETLGIDVYTKYIDTKPRIMVSHVCPEIPQRRMFPRTVTIQTRTKTIMNQMLEVHQPEYWVFGHHHIHVSFKEEKTLFVCCGMLRSGVSAQKNKRAATFEIPSRTRHRKKDVKNEID